MLTLTIVIYSTFITERRNERLSCFVGRLLDKNHNTMTLGQVRELELLQAAQLHAQSEKRQP